jgi:hypothetical protein
MSSPSSSPSPSPTAKRKPLLSMLIPSALRRSPASSPDPSTKGGMMFANSDALLAQQMHLMLAIDESGSQPSLSHRSMDGSYHSVASSSDDDGLLAASRWGAECYAESPNSPALFASLNRQVAMELRPAPMIRSSSNLKKQSADAAPAGFWTSGRAA